jgi:hypothetical protein
MVRSYRRPRSTAPTVGQRPQPRKLGVIGKGSLTPYEEEGIRYIGRCIAVLGHTLVIAEAPGVAAAVRGGVEVEGGEVLLVPNRVIEQSDLTLVYADSPLLTRLRSAYPDLDTRVTMIDNIDRWLDAIKTIFHQLKLEPPG